MNSRTILAALVGAVVSFLMGFLLYGLLLMDYFESNIQTYEGLMKPDEDAMIGYVVSSILQGILMCYILNSAGVRSLGKGAIMGAIVVLLIGAWTSTWYLTGMNWYTSYSVFIVDILASGVMGLVIGGAVGWMLGRGNKTAA